MIESITDVLRLYDIQALDLVLLMYLAHLSRSTSDLEVIVASHASEVCEFLVNSIRERRLSLVQNASGRRKKSPSVSRDDRDVYVAI